MFFLLTTGSGRIKISASLNPAFPGSATISRKSLKETVMTLPHASSISANSPQPARRPLPSKLDSKLIAYSAAAAASGVGLLAMSGTAEAKIVYTAANLAIPANQTVSVDINNDGVPDFAFYFYQYGQRKPLTPPLGYHQDNLVIEPSKTGNEVWGIQSVKGTECAAALPPSVKVGPGAGFVQANSVLIWGSGGSAYSTVTRCKFGTLPRGGFLGLKFLINGQTHYGWAHVTVRNNNAVLNGYAYETVPNQSIRTGETSGPVEVGTFMPGKIPAAPATLGLLAQGSQGLDIWRKSEKDLEN
jgi:hypothetical protein